MAPSPSRSRSATPCWGRCSATRDGSAPSDLPWTRRALLAAVAFAGSAAFAWAFARDAQASRLATAVAVAAGASWPVFGLALLAVTRARPSAWAWADACLRTMAPGIAVLAAAAGWGLLAGAHAWLVLAAVAASNLTMLAVFVRQAVRLGLSAAWAIALWVVVLDGFFALVAWWWL